MLFVASNNDAWNQKPKVNAEEEQRVINGKT